MKWRDRGEQAVTGRRLPIGAEVIADGGVHFRVWAPRCASVEVIFENLTTAKTNAKPIRLEAGAHGYFPGVSDAALPGMLYRFRLDGKDELYPDPASRFQPQGPHGPSEIVDPAQFKWTDADWGGVELFGQVIYEMHIGVYTPQGSWAAAEQQLPELKDLGISVIEMMPVNEFTGRFGWGYDGVDLYAPTHLYGRPDDLRRFVDRAHALGVGVILDVVYNHLGPDGNYLKCYSEDYFSKKHKTDWGEALNYDGENAASAREFFVCNAGYWIDEYHFDGLRLDATDNIYDDSPKHVIADIGERVHQAGRGRSTIVIAENERQDVNLLKPVEKGGCALSGVWNDDFHHSARVALTGQREAYYTDYCGTAQELLSAIKRGYLYQGQWYAWQKKRRGSDTRGIEPWRFINFLENHDQIANSGFGAHLNQLSHPGCFRALTALLLLAPSTPLLFQGQEFGASTCFTYFADHQSELAKTVYQGRLKFVAQFPSLAQAESQAQIPDPSAPRTFELCKLKLDERRTHSQLYQLHRDLLRLRRTDPVFREQGRTGFDGAVLAPRTLVLRFFGAESDRLLLINLDVDVKLDPVPEPLLAPPKETDWALLWSSEHPQYCGRGIVPPHMAGNWIIQGYSAQVLTSVRAESAKTEES